MACPTLLNQVCDESEELEFAVWLVSVRILYASNTNAWEACAISASLVGISLDVACGLCGPHCTAVVGSSFVISLSLRD